MTIDALHEMWHPCRFPCLFTKTGFKDTCRIMPKNNSEQHHPPETDVEYLKGCPLCEHSDPELERELQTFAQLLFDLYLEKHSKKKPDSETDVDKGPRPPTLK